MGSSNVKVKDSPLRKPRLRIPCLCVGLIWLWAGLVTSTHKRGLPRLCVDSGMLVSYLSCFHTYAWTLNLVGKVRATPRLPGVRLGVDVLALGLRVVDPCICVDIYAYTWIGQVGGHA
ncbi:hypothetical protein PIB30_081844 [Stylosanthes scabra]|uniref:Uncharacterized protein n=1 Tax=Stylosanthes scabra TaxID=79078 RepID=A0ABU6VUG0_9FABA|nr:hypothetical protein [Stylosanthes scabra]